MIVAGKSSLFKVDQILGRWNHSLLSTEKEDAVFVWFWHFYVYFQGNQ